MTETAVTERGRRTSELVLRTALRLFTSRGFFNTSIHDIQREGGVSIGSIYHHFHSKEQIAKALYDKVLGEIEQLVEETISHQTTAEDRCRALQRQMLLATEEDPDTMQFILYARHRELMPDSRPICSSRPFERIRGIVQEGMESGEIRPMDTWVAASALFGGTIRMIQLKLDGMVDDYLPDHADELWEAAWRGVSADRSAGGHKPAYPQGQT